MYKIFLLLLCVSLHAQLTIDLSQNQVVRRGAPFFLSVFLQSDYTTKGRLGFYQQRQPFYTSQELLITTDKKNKFVFFLPPTNSDLDIFWETETQKIFLDNFQNNNITNFVLYSTQKMTNTLDSSLNVFSYLPKLPHENNLRIHHLDMNYLPQHFLQYLVADVVVIHSKHLLQMKEREFRALKKWIGIGGSACLSVIQPNSYRRHIQEFLEKIGSSGVHSFGLGKVFICDSKWEYRAKHAYPKYWREHVLKLWKVRNQSIQKILNNDNDISNYPLFRQFRRNTQKLKTSYTYNNENAAKIIGNQFLPKRVGIPPATHIAILLILFLLTTGPVEYILLKKINRPSWMWVTLPCTTLLLLFLCQRGAYSYLGNAKLYKSLCIIDIDHRDQVLQVNEVFFVMYADLQLLPMDWQNAIFTNLTFKNMIMFRSQKPFTKYYGHFPANYTVTQKIPKWQPYLQRIYYSDRQYQKKSDPLPNVQEKYSLLSMYQKGLRSLPKKSSTSFVYTLHQTEVATYQKQMHPLAPFLIQASASIPGQNRIFFARTSPRGSREIVY